MLENSRLIALVHHLFRSKSKSLMGFYVYTNSIHQYPTRLNLTPDQIIADVKCDDPKEYAARVEKHRKFLQDCLDELDNAGS